MASRATGARAPRHFAVRERRFYGRIGVSTPSVLEALELGYAFQTLREANVLARQINGHVESLWVTIGVHQRKDAAE